MAPGAVAAAAAADPGENPPPESSSCPLLLIAPAASYRTAAYLAAARALGQSVLLASAGELPLVPANVTGVRLTGSSRTELLACLPSGVRIRAVLATDDETVPLASRVAAALGLPHNPTDAALASTRKDIGRARLAAAGVPVPEFLRLDLNAPLAEPLASLCYPVVLKPLALSGSRGVIRADDPQSALQAAQRIARLLVDAGVSGETGSTLLVERYVPGSEFALEGLLESGRLRVLGLFDKPDPLCGPFFAETLYVTPSRLATEEQEQIRRIVERACAAYGLHSGPVHAEIRGGSGKFIILEVAARTIGGLCAQLFELVAGTTWEEMVIRNALGESLAEPSQELARAADGGPMCAGIYMLPVREAGILRRVEGVGAARRLPGILELIIWLREGYELVPLPEGASYLGFIFAQGDTPGQVEQFLRDAARELRVVVAPALPVRVGAVGDPNHRQAPGRDHKKSPA
ncbi:MAG: ATP-grasp domain-containing protein [Gammaproteobacteria bacterium]|nr:ATP-grasp domain-containing protein [Gammaproteobacteria bacterium]